MATFNIQINTFVLCSFKFIFGIMLNLDFVEILQKNIVFFFNWRFIKYSTFYSLLIIRFTLSLGKIQVYIQ